MWLEEVLSILIESIQEYVPDEQIRSKIYRNILDELSQVDRADDFIDLDPVLESEYNKYIEENEEE